MTCAVLRLGSANQRADMTRPPVINHTLPHSHFLSLWSCWSSPSRGRGLCGGDGGMFSQRTRSYGVERVDCISFYRPTKPETLGSETNVRFNNHTFCCLAFDFAFLFIITRIFQTSRRPSHLSDVIPHCIRNIEFADDQHALPRL